MKKKLFITLGVMAVILVTTVAGIVKAKIATVKVEVVKLEDRHVRDTIMIPGTLWFSEERGIYKDPQYGGIEEILVKVGDSVEVGDPLLHYRNDNLNLEDDRNQLSIESSYLKINNIKDQLNELKNKERELTKQIGKNEANNQISTERKQLEVEQKMADIEARTHLLEKETIKKKKANLEVKSDIKGKVIAINSQGDSANSPLIYIVNPNRLVVTGSVSEYDSLKVKEKQPVKISSDIIPNETWNGVVSQIGSLPEQAQDIEAGNNENSMIKYPIEISVIDKEIPAKPGFKLIMEIETDKRLVPTIPWSSVKSDEEEGYIVFVVINNQVKSISIEIGSSYGEYVEVVNGLTPDNQIINNPPDKLTNSMEVTVE